MAPLTDLGRDDIERAGGKGANLGELVRAGLPVPPGFVVTAAAYDDVVAQAGISEIISRREERDSGAAIRDAFAAAAIPPEIKRDIVEAYRKLGQGPVAVRSSATAEDLPDSAFAGQQDTFLNVIGAEAVLVAVQRCWASLWTDRAIAYRTQRGFGHHAVKLGVVVQRMVEAEVGGVLFTANPVTGARDETVIDANPGLGEAVVSGVVTPDHFVLRRRRLGWRVVERRPGRREVIVRARPGGGTEQAEGTTAAAAPALPDRALRRLADLGAAIERHFGRPQDVEWAWAGGGAFVVQARPITALPEPTARLGRMRHFAAGLMAELFPVRPYPLDVTTWTAAILHAVEGLLRYAGVRFPPAERIFVEEDGVVVRLVPPAPRPTPRVLLTPVRLQRQARRFDPARWRTDPALAEVQQRTRALADRDLKALSWPELLATVEEGLAIPSVAMQMRLQYLPRAALAAGRLVLILRVLRRTDRLDALLTASDSETAQMGRDVEALAARIRSDRVLSEIFAREESPRLPTALEADPAGRAFLDELRPFLDRYGHRETTTPLLASQPTWQDAPWVVLGLLKGFAAAPPPVRARPTRQAVRDELLAHPLARLRPVRSAILDGLDQIPRIVQIREDTRFYATMPLPAVRHALLEFGRRLVAAGVLDAPEDVFHLKLAELKAVGENWPPAAEVASELRAVAGRRKAKRASLAGTSLLDPRLLRQPEIGGDVLLRGIPGSPGVAEGPVRVILDPSQFSRLRPGDVLVAPYTHPAWTPLFRFAAAVVVDSGGPVSHAAIVAREYGIPAVMATGDGTRRLTEERRVRVDGTRGLVLAG